MIGENHKLLVFKINEVPVMTRGRGVILQKFKDGGLSDARAFALSDGLSCRQGSRIRTFVQAEIDDWIGRRGNTGRLAPKGFPKSNKFA